MIRFVFFFCAAFWLIHQSGCTNSVAADWTALPLPTQGVRSHLCQYKHVSPKQKVLI